MSVSYSASLVMGVRLSEVMRIEDREESITKYNENTGKPYQTKVTKTHWFLGDKEIDQPEAPGAPDEWHKLLQCQYGFSTGWPGSYAVFSTGTDSYGEDHPDLDSWVLGTLMATCEDEKSSIAEISPSAVNEAEVDVADRLKKLGVTAKPRLMLVLDCSY